MKKIISLLLIITLLLPLGVSAQSSDLNNLANVLQSIKSLVNNLALQIQGTTQTAAVATNNLVAYYSFDEGSGTTANDTSGNNNDGTINGASWTSGISGNALSFDGVDDFVETVSNVEQDVADSNHTISIWVRPDNLNGTQVLLMRPGYETYLRSIGGGISYTKSSAGTRHHHVLHTLATEQWTHVVVVQDKSSNEIRVYINGVSTYTDFEGDDDSSITSNPLYLATYANSSNYLQGSLDELRIYNRTLSQSEVLDLYNNPGQGGGSTPTPTPDPTPDPTPSPTDTTPPTVSNGSPTGTLSSNTTNVTLRVNTNESAVCKYSTSAAASYFSMNSYSSTGGTTHTANIIVQPNQSYTYYTKCQDTPAGNTSSNYTISFSVPNTPAPQPAPTPTTPIGNFPSAVSGSHISSIQDISPGSWLNLGQPKADPVCGVAQGRSWGVNAMVIDPELRIAYYTGEGRHGWVKSDGYGMDDFWIYDINTNSWVCVYRGTDTVNFTTKIQNGDLYVNEYGLVVDRNGDLVPGHLHTHAYSFLGLNTHTNEFTFMSHNGGGYGRYFFPGANLESVYEGLTLLEGQGLNQGNHQWGPWKYNLATEKFTRELATGQGPSYYWTPTFPVFIYIPSIKEFLYAGWVGTALYDPETKNWRRLDNPGSLNSGGGAHCGRAYDPVRDRVYVGCDSDSVHYFDVKTEKWVALPGDGDTTFVLSTNHGGLYYDDVNDRLSAVSFGANGGIKHLDLDTNTWSGVESIPVSTTLTHAMTYDPVLGVLFVHVARDSGDGVMWVHRPSGNTPPPLTDTVPPILSNGSPTGSLNSGTTNTNLSISTNEAATCRYSTNSATSYNSMTNFTTTGGATHTTNVGGLGDGLSYNYYVRCQDEARNTSSRYTVNFRVASGQNDSTPTGSADWTERSTGSGVVWAHDFTNPYEVDRFRWVSGWGLDVENETNSLAFHTTEGCASNGCLEIQIPGGAPRTGASWWRPFSALQGVPDKGIPDDIGYSGGPTWDADNYRQTNIWGTGNYGHPDYHDSTFDGTDFYLQVRIKITGGRDHPDNPGAKLLYITRMERALPQQQIVSGSGGYFSMFSAGGQLNGHMNDPQGSFSAYGGVFPGDRQFFPHRWVLQPGGEYDATCRYDLRGDDRDCWNQPLDEWFTLLFHVTPGHENDGFAGLYDGTANYDTGVQVWAAREGETEYTKIWDKDNYAFDFTNAYPFAFNGFIATDFTGPSPLPAEGWSHMYDEIIFSKEFIPAPSSDLTPSPNPTPQPTPTPGGGGSTPPPTSGGSGGTPSSGGSTNTGGTVGGGVVTPTVGSGDRKIYTFTRNLRIGSRGDDVKQLQKFLNDRGYTISTTGVGSKGNESSYFGQKTAEALKKFQNDHKAEVLTPNNLTRGNGYFGASTRSKVNELYTTIASTNGGVINTDIDTTGQTNAELEALIAQLLEQVAQLTAQLNARSGGTTVTSPTTRFTRTLRLGSRGEDVRRLQQFLNQDPATQISGTTGGSPGRETAYFGKKTEDALKRYQAKHGIVSSGTPSTTGYGVLGPRTRAKVNP